MELNTVVQDMALPCATTESGGWLGLPDSWIQELSTDMVQ